MYIFTYLYIYVHIYIHTYIYIYIYIYLHKCSYIHIYVPAPALSSVAAPSSRGYRSTSLIRNSAPLGPYRRTMPRALRWCWGGRAVSYARGTPVYVLRQ